MYNFYKASCLLNVRQLPSISNEIDCFGVFNDLKDPSTDLFEEFQTYMNYQDDLPNPFNLLAFCNANNSGFPLLEQNANKATWMPATSVTSVNAEHSFSQYKHLLNKQ